MLCDLSTGKCPRCGFMTRHIGAKKVCAASDSGSKTRSRGVGDTVAKVLGAVGIQPCGGCDERKDLLNKYFPYKQGSENPPDVLDKNDPKAEDK